MKWFTVLNNWRQYGQLNTKVSSFVDAKQKCKENGGKLPEPKTSGSNDFWAGLGISQLFFLGLKETATVGKWEWISDNSTAAWTNFIPGEPVGGTHGKCAAMNRDATDVANKKRWISVHCYLSIPRPVVCERELSK